jgi:hypothetical protein
MNHMKFYSDIVNKQVLPNQHLLYYKRDKKGRKIGLVLAYKDSANNVVVGWSMCNVKRERGGFDRDMGLAHAIRNSYYLNDYNNPEVLNKVPHGIRKELDYMVDRARRYYFKHERLMKQHANIPTAPPAVPVDKYLDCVAWILFGRP